MMATFSKDFDREKPRVCGVSLFFLREFEKNFDSWVDTLRDDR